MIFCSISQKKIYVQKSKIWNLIKFWNLFEFFLTFLGNFLEKKNLFFEDFSLRNFIKIGQNVDFFLKFFHLFCWNVGWFFFLNFEFVVWNISAEILFRLILFFAYKKAFFVLFFFTKNKNAKKWDPYLSIIGNIRWKKYILWEWQKISLYSICSFYKVD